MWILAARAKAPDGCEDSSEDSHEPLTCTRYRRESPFRAEPILSIGPSPHSSFSSAQSHIYLSSCYLLETYTSVMSLPSFPSSPPVSSPTVGHGPISITGSRGPGAGNLLPKALLIVCGVCSLIGKLIPSLWTKAGPDQNREQRPSSRYGPSAYNSRDIDDRIYRDTS